MKVLINRYKFFIITVFIVGLVAIYDIQLGIKVFNIVGFSFKEMALAIPPIFILLGLLDIWVPRDIMVKYMGEGSGVKGIVLSLLLGSAAAGPLYGAFPVAAVFMKKGVKFINVLIFIGAWSTTKIPMLLFEIASLGSKFALTRLLIDIPGIIIIAYLLSITVSDEEIKQIYENAEKL